MKTFAIAFGFLLACVSALPNQHTVRDIESAIRAGQRNLITGLIVDAIEELAQSIRDAGLDPLHVEHEALDYALPVPAILNLKAGLENLHFRGLSNIVINRMNYNTLAFRLNFNIELPQILLSTSAAHWDVNLFDRNFSGRISGGVSVNKIVIIGEVRVSVGLLSGITIRSIDVDFTCGSIDSRLAVDMQGVNLSDNVNTFLGKTIPGTLHAYKRDIDKLISIVALEIANEML